MQFWPFFIPHGLNHISVNGFVIQKHPPNSSFEHISASRTLASCSLQLSAIHSARVVAQYCFQFLTTGKKLFKWESDKQQMLNHYS